MEHRALTDRHMGTTFLAHEVNKAASALLINAEAALRWLDKSPADVLGARRSIELIIRNGGRVCSLAAAFRETSLLPRPARDPIDVNRILDDVLGLFHAEILGEGIVVERNYSIDLNPIPADQAQLEQVFVNLITNSIEAMSSVKGRPKYVRVGTYQVDQGQVLIAIEDAGEPIHSEDVEHVFDYLYTTKPNGTGAGLAICRAIVVNHGGRIWAERNGGHGSTFRMILPGSERPSAS